MRELDYIRWHGTLALATVAITSLLLGCGDDEPAAPLPSDPTVSVTAPADGDTVYESVTLSATASDDRGIAKVDFFVNGSPLPGGTDFTPPYLASWNVLDLPNGSAQSVYARATDTDGNTAGSQTVVVTVDNTRGVPRRVELAVTSVTDSSIALSWTPVTDPDFAVLKLYLSSSPGVTESSLQIVSLTDRLVTSFGVMNLVDGQSYFFRAFVIDSVGFSAGSNEVSAATVNRSPDPSILAIIDPADWRSISLQWGQNGDHDFASYRLYRLLSADVDTNATLVFNTETRTATTVVDSPLVADTRYYYRLYTFDWWGLASASNVVDVTTPSCPTPAGLVILTPTCGSVLPAATTIVSADWTKDVAATSYEVTLFEGSQCMGVPLQGITTQQTATQFSGLMAGNTYTFRVRGLNDQCEPATYSEWSPCCGFSVAPEATVVFSDDFDGSVLDPLKWSMEATTNPSVSGPPSEFGISQSEGRFHSAQLVQMERELIMTALFDLMPGDAVEYEIAKVSGTGNHISRIFINHATFFWPDLRFSDPIGYWNGEMRAGDAVGTYHVRIEFLNASARVLVTNPFSVAVQDTIEGISAPYRFSFVSRSGSNGQFHFDYDNVMVYR